MGAAERLGRVTDLHDYIGTLDADEAMSELTHFAAMLGGLHVSDPMVFDALAKTHVSLFMLLASRIADVRPDLPVVPHAADAVCVCRLLGRAMEA